MKRRQGPAYGVRRPASVRLRAGRNKCVRLERISARAENWPLKCDYHFSLPAGRSFLFSLSLSLPSAFAAAFAFLVAFSFSFFLILSLALSRQQRLATGHNLHTGGRN